MATLAGNTIASTYPLLLKIDSSGIDGTLRAVEDGDGTDSALSIATDSVLVKGDGVKLYFYDADGSEHISADASGNLTIASGAKINLTATSDVHVANGTGVVIGHTAQETISIGDGSTDLVPEVQILGTAQTDASLMLAAFSTTATSAGAPLIALVKGGNGTIGSHTVVTDGEELGNIIAYGDDGTDLESPAASIQFEVDGTPGSSDMPGRIIFNTTADGATALTERLRISANGVVDGGFLKENLLINSGFDVWSNSTAELVGSELVTNGDFSSDTSSWANDNADLASVAGGQSGNCLRVTRTGGSTQTTQQGSFATEIGKLYEFSVYVKSGTSGDDTFRVGVFASNLDDKFVSGSTTSSWVKHSFIYESIDTASYIRLSKLGSTAGTMLFDTVSLKEVAPGCVASSGLACDGWEKGTSHSAFDIWRQHNDGGTYTHDGSFYSLKMNYDRASQPLYGYLYQGGGTDEFTQKFAGKTVTLGCWVKSPVAGKAGIGFDDTANTFAGEGDELLTSGTGWEWLELTKTFGASISGAWFYLRVLGHAGSVSGTHVGYYSQPILVFGSSIGEGNYTRPKDEIIWGEDRHHLTDYSGESFSDIASPLEVNLEAQSKGKIPKGVKAVYVVLWARDSDTTTDTPFVKLWGYDRDMPMLGVDNNFADAAGRDDVYSYSYGWVPTAENGDFAITVAASGSSTTDIYISIMGYQLA